jgi:translation initiation factor IF-2
LTKEKIRIFALARELDMESKDLLVMCRQHGIDVKNQLSTIEPEVRDQIVQLVKRGATASPAPPVAVKPAPVLRAPQNQGKIKELAPSRSARGGTTAASPGGVAVLEEEPSGKKATASEMQPPVVAGHALKTPAPPTMVPGLVDLAGEATSTPTAKPGRPPDTVAPSKPLDAARAPAVPKAPEGPAKSSPPPPSGQEPPTGPAKPVRPGPLPAGIPNLGSSGRSNLPSRGDGARRTPSPRSQPRVGGAMPSGARPPIQRQKVPDQPKPPAAPTGPKKIFDIPKDLIHKEGQITAKDLEEKLRGPGGGGSRPAPPGTTPVPYIDDDDGDEGDGKDKSKGNKRLPGGIVGREARHKERNERQARRKEGGEIKGGRLLLEDDSPRHRKDRRYVKPKARGTEQRKGKVPIDLPITVRSLSEAIGRSKGELLFKLMALGAPPSITINSMVDPDMAETVAIEYNVELEIKRAVDAEQSLVDESKRADNPEDLVYRAPVVTIMGHVDHGKTSLLDQIRRSNVVDTEAGGITQVIRAWRVEHHGKPITFLDTPGHEAFTKMRARGANVTDIAVIVVAANDGVMPQTEEAINHAKAAGVSMVVAINKVDLPDANLKKTEQQLYSLGLIPDTMGGEVPFVQTSAKSGKGIDDLLEHLTIVAELKDLKANPNKPGAGTCLEAHLSEKEGVLATLLVQDGTLRVGDVVLCGATYGTIRRMYDDLGRPLDEAGPGVPVRITGLSSVPNADDPFLIVPEVSTAREIADRRRAKILEKALAPKSTMSLESLKESKVAELKVILKAEARGSIEAIKAELAKLKHEEVRVRILHDAIGGITVSDVQLALTSPEDTLIVGFNAVPDDAARALAEERAISIRQYNIIYQLADDIRSALEGKLKPREDIIHLGRAVVRETFKISRVGTIAGCYVTQGTIERSAKIRVIRSGVVVYPPAERTVGLESLKRFKEDVKEVREGFECGIKVAGYDDIKVDDVIEAYRIEQVLRKLS